MISRESILRRLPSELNPKQSLFFDGIRHAGEIASLAHARLSETLTRIATQNPEENKFKHLFTDAFLNAWTLVDSIHRFRMLWKSLPGSDCKLSETYTDFMEVYDDVHNLRNVADHLAQRADYVVANNGAALGVLSWFTITNPDKPEGVSCIIIPGTIRSSDVIAPNPVGRSITVPTGLIYLAAGEYKANLSKATQRMAACIKEIETSVEKGIANAGLEGKQAGADVLLITKISGV